MAALQWKNGASWEDIPAAALYSTWAGTYHIEYPPPQEVAIDGTQAGGRRASRASSSKRPGCRT